MIVRFLVDAQLAPALARLIVRLGHSADHVIGCALHMAPDVTISVFA